MGYQADFDGPYRYNLIGDQEGTDDSDLSDEDFSPMQPKRVLRYNPDLTFCNGFSSSSAAAGVRNDVSHCRTLNSDFTFCQAEGDKKITEAAV
jgi:hypothetical protein